MPAPAPPRPFLSVSELVRNGWTRTLVDRLLGEPDKLARNPFFKSSPPLRLYARTRVEAIEESAEWAELAPKAAVRKEAGRKAAATKRAALLEAVRALRIDVPNLPIEELRDRACESFNVRHYERELDFWRERDYDWTPATPASDPAFLCRISVNYLRHELTSYEDELARTFGKVGVREAYVEINRKVYAAISACYPSLAFECENQLARKQAEHAY